MSSGTSKALVILASGDGSVAQAIIDSASEPTGALYGRVAITQIVTENPHAGILERANRAKLPSALVEFRSGSERREWERELHSVVAAADPWLVVSAGFMKILSPWFVSSFRIINTHPSLLPKFPGAHAVRDALAAGVRESGCTLHFMDAGVDTGEIIEQRSLEILPHENEAALHSRIKVLERELIITGILRLLEEEQ